MDVGDVEREIDELEFLVGNSCSRAINLLMQPERNREGLRDEMAFLGEKATRLAELLATLERDVPGVEDEGRDEAGPQRPVS